MVTQSVTGKRSLQRAAAAVAAALICALYVANLTGMGLVGPDEPRYSAIGRAMAATGDWVTPRLWGAPWFEKPALLYWMTASGFKLGLNPELAPRLPVALLSLCFLAFFWWKLRGEWNDRTAWISTGLLATSAGWLTYSHVSVTDIPLSVFFSAAVLLALPWIARGDRRNLPAAACCLALATLAKGLVPVVLFLPVLAIGWRRALDWFRPVPLIAFSVIALPWYVLCTLRNGSEFPRVFFLEHQFGRFSSAALQHAQPWWFYIPALALLLFPWFPLLAVTRPDFKDPRHRMLAAIAAFGLVFFSASVNKLPSYVLPLVPALCVLAGTGLATIPRPGLRLVLPAALLGLLPAIAKVIPMALAHGLRAAIVPWAEAGIGFSVVAAVGLALRMKAETWAIRATILFAALGFLWLQFETFPNLDAAASARPLWLADRPECSPPLNRSMQYGLNYYAERELPPCPPAIPARR
jgi:4-amino-4-deoxy-L-arabinose transferase-like glycosyltransferase